MQTRALRAYEVKRGFGLHDSGKRRSMLRDTLSVQVLLKNYGKERGLDVQEAFSHIIFYCGQCSIPKPFALTGAELDEHVNRHWNGTPYRHPKGTPLIGEF